jgi:hypothetical protein
MKTSLTALALALVVVVANAACTASSPSSSQQPSGGPPGHGSTCTPNLAPYADSVQALATDGTDAFVVTAGPAGERVISVAKSGALTQLASVASDSTFSIQEPALVVDADAFYVDAVRGKDRPLIRVDRKTGAQATLAAIQPGGNRTHPLFVADDAYLYYQGVDLALGRVAKTGGAPASWNGGPAGSDIFYGAEGLDAELLIDDASVYYVRDGGGTTSAAVFTVAKTSKIPPSAGAAPNASAVDFGASNCQEDPFRAALDRGTVYATCTNADQGQNQNWVYAMPGVQPSGGTVAATLIDNLAGLEKNVIVVVQGNLYFAASTSPSAGFGVFKVAVDGGEPASFLVTGDVDHMVASATMLFVSSSCGVQSVPL